MKYRITCLFSLLAIILLLATMPQFSHAEEGYARIKRETLEGGFEFDIKVILGEYYYHGSKWGDSKEFSAEREQQLIKMIEDKYFAAGHTKLLSEKFSLIFYSPSVAFAKMFLRYGADGLKQLRGGTTALMYMVYHVYSPPSQQDLAGDEVQKIITKELAEDYGSHDSYKKFGSTLPPNHAIELAKLYLSLGIDIHTIVEGSPHNPYSYSENALTYSFTRYYLKNEEYNGNISLDDVPPRDPNPLPDYYQIPLRPDTNHYAYRKSKITRWLESFIEAEYPASMLDVHRLLYPRYMAGASVTDIETLLASVFDNEQPTDINMMDAMGRTPLHIAGEAGNKAVYDYLISQSADTTIKDYRNNLPTLKSE